MDIITTYQTSLQVVEHSAGVAERDPHGIIISLISVTIVFLSLIILYLAYELIGVIVNRWFIKKKDGRFVVEESLNSSGSDVHDMESYVITINRKATPVLKTVDRGTRIISNSNSDEEATGHQNRQSGTADGIIRSPLPGTILKVIVKEGDAVEIGQPVAVLEAMKMENTIEAERNGTVTRIYVSQGDSILEGSEIIAVE